MAQQTYISCIKINGVPILPPMITEDVRKEVKYYKYLAIQVEKRLKALYNRKFSEESQSIENNTEVQEIDQKFHFGNENITPNAEPNIDGDQLSTKNTYDITTNENVDIYVHKQSSHSELVQEISSNQNSETNFTEGQSFSPTSTVVSIDSIESLIDTTKSNVEQKMLDNWKPEVPKTLNIVPITLNDSNSYQKEEFSVINETNTIKRTPKLVRQDSYILDTPSPMLLAHMQIELNNINDIPTAEYIPTPAKSSVRRKEWNIAHTKTDWISELKNNEFNAMDTQQTLKNSKCKRKSLSSKSNYNLYKTESEQTILEPQTRMYQTTGSVDSIQMMLEKENIYKPDIKNNNNKKKYSISNNDKENHRPQEWKESKNISMLNTTNKLGGSLGNLHDIETQMHKINESQILKTYGQNESFEEENTNNDKINESIGKSKSPNISEKLLTILKEIEEVHKRQMSELVIRQQQEQSSLQKEFEKQQLLLLAEIKKSFPEISSLIDDKYLSSTTLDQAESRNNSISKDIPINKTKQDKDLKELSVVPKDDVLLSPNKRTLSPICPVNYIYSKNDFNDTKQHLKCYEFIQSSQRESNEISTHEYNCTLIKNKEIQENTNKNEMRDYNTSVINENKKSTISRRLFPLDCKTVHVPIIDSSMYAEKHIQAASIINAYTRGYLVRRLFKTNRVITLKNTYKEALKCMLKLHVDAPLDLSELHFLRRLQLQCDAASMNIVELFSQSPAYKMKIIAHDREIKRCRTERPTSARSYSFATQRTLARKKLKEMKDYKSPIITQLHSSRVRCQTWTSEISQHLISPNTHHTIKRSTSAGTVRKPWR
ncbi:PREDICTED: myb-like protein P [Polistes canadensis]|uniref:myb-like protein P n=1 Tax=Polistes canadensis TaxID=91411 RepID=UPI00071905A5|nr:PREDICTED: myb-like protein P [Polistes canadensis]